MNNGLTQFNNLLKHRGLSEIQITPNDTGGSQPKPESL